MLVLDFLQLMNDLRRQTRFYYTTKAQKWCLVTVKKITIEKQDCLVMTTAKHSKSLQQWELRYLLDRPDYRPLPVYLDVAGEKIAVFGFRLVDNEAWLN